MTRPWFRNLLRRVRGKKRPEGQSATQLTVLATPADSSPPLTEGLNRNNSVTRVRDQDQGSVTLPSVPPFSSAQAATDPDTPPVGPLSRCVLRSLPAPYASNAELWREALAQLDESARDNIEMLLNDPGDESADNGATDVKSLAVTIQEHIGAAFKQKDNKLERIMDSSMAVLGKFVSAVDVAVSFDPVHAALPWAAVRSVLVLVTSNSELKTRLITGIALVASLVAQCDIYQQLYMAPDLALRPSETSLSRLKTDIVRTYAKAQLFLSFAIKQQQRSKLRVATAAFEVGDAESHINELSKCEKMLTQASDTCERHCNLSNRSAVQELLSLKADISKIFQDQIESLMDRLERNEHVRLLEWISPIPYGQHHNRVKEDRTANTCEWLLRHQKFREWEDSSLSTILWLQGIPGAGKTFLTSKVIDHRRTVLATSPNQEGFAFFYCNRNEEERRKPISVLQSYVRQLSTTVRNPDSIRKELQECCQKARASGSDLGFTDCREQILESIRLYSQTTLVLDALDECESKSRGQLLEMIEYLISNSKNGLKVFISSRPDRDIRDRFLKTPNIEIKATDNEEDIQKYVRETIVHHGNWGDMSPKLQNDIVNKLFTKSQGMFQWAFLQINVLLELETETAIRHRLDSLPADLKIAYDEIYGKIKARDQYDTALADRAFKWVACAKEPLTSETLLSAIRLDSETTTLDISQAITESQLLHLCNNLLVIDSKQKVWRFSHLSVREYFEFNHWDLQSGHFHAACVCLKSLIIVYANAHLDELGSEISDVGSSDSDSQLGHVYTHGTIDDEQSVNVSLEPEPATSDFGSSDSDSQLGHVYTHGTIDDEQSVNVSLEPEPATSDFGSSDSDSQLGHVYTHGTIDDEQSVDAFQLRRFVHDHSRRWWAYYIQAQEKQEYESVLAQLLKLFLGSPTESSLQYRAWHAFTSDYVFHHDSAPSSTGEISPATMALFAMCRFSLYDILLDWWKDTIFDISALTDEGDNLISLAVKGRCAQICEHLIHRGIQVNEPLHGTYGSALAAAVYERNEEIVKLLIREGADVNMQLQHRRYGSALAAAVYAKNRKMVKLLIREGADVNMQLQHGWYGSALAAAVYAENQEMVKLLIRKGADLNMRLQHGIYGSALAAAVYERNEEMAKLLIREGADLNMQLQYRQYGSSLAAVVYAANHELAKLLRKGADVNMQLQSGDCGRALIHAVHMRAEDKVELLVVNAKADVNQQAWHGRFGTALAAAAYYGFKGCADILIKAGADVNLEIQNGKFRTAMEATQSDDWNDWIGLFYRNFEEWKRAQEEVAELLQQHSATDDVSD